MESYFAENTTLILSTDSDLFKFLKNMVPDSDNFAAQRALRTDDNSPNRK